MGRRHALLVLLAIGLVLTGYSMAQGGAINHPTGSLVDGWPIGERNDCRAVPCDEMIVAATEALQRRDGGTAAIVDVSIYDREQRPPIRSTAPKIAVFKLVGDEFKAIAVYETFTGPLQTIEFGP